MVGFKIYFEDRAIELVEELDEEENGDAFKPRGRRVKWNRLKMK